MNLVDLPEEIKQKILKYLSFTDLKAVCCVSRKWRKMGENPDLWRHFQLFARTEMEGDHETLNHRGGNLLKPAMQALALTRLCKVRSVHLVHISFWIHTSIFDIYNQRLCFSKKVSPFDTPWVLIPIKKGPPLLSLF